MFAELSWAQLEVIRSGEENQDPALRGDRRQVRQEWPDCQLSPDVYAPDLTKID